MSIQIYIDIGIYLHWMMLSNVKYTYLYKYIYIYPIPITDPSQLNPWMGKPLNIVSSQMDDWLVCQLDNPQKTMTIQLNAETSSPVL